MSLVTSWVDAGRRLAGCDKQTARNYRRALPLVLLPLGPRFSQCWWRVQASEDLQIHSLTLTRIYIIYIHVYTLSKWWINIGKKRKEEEKNFCCPEESLSVLLKLRGICFCKWRKRWIRRKNWRNIYKKWRAIMWDELSTALFFVTVKGVLKLTGKISRELQFKNGFSSGSLRVW